MPKVDPKIRAETLIYLRGGGPNALDPGIAAGTGDYPIEQQIYEQLVRLDPKAPGLVRGMLAKNWSIAPDGLTIDFELNDDHRFSDGSNVDAEAVKFSFERAKSLGKSPSSLLDWLAWVEVTGPYSLRLHLSRAYSPAVQMLSQAAASVVNPRAVRAHEANDKGVGWLSEHSAGSGPYMLSQYQPNETVVLVPNPYATTPIRGFKRVEFRFLPDEGVRRLLLERGDADISEPVSAAFVARYRALPHVKVAQVPSGTSISFLTLNTRKGPMRDVRLRQAVAAAVDYHGLRADVLKGVAGQLAGYITPDAPGYDPNEPVPHRNLAEARRLVKESGYRGQPLKLLIGQVGPVSEFLQGNLQDAGLNVVLERRSGAATMAAKKAGDFDLIYDGWYTDTPDAGGMFEGIYASRSIPAGLNGSGYSNPEVDKLIDRALAQQDPDKRGPIFRQIDAILRRDRPLVMIFAADPVVAYRDDIEGMVLNPLRPFALDLAELSRRDTR